jgi:hypothetical protein
MSNGLKIHAVTDSSHDGYEVTTACGLDGWRNDGLTQWYTRRHATPGGETMFLGSFEHSSVTCKRCISSLSKEPSNA